jgi:hypothetical protein
LICCVSALYKIRQGLKMGGFSSGYHTDLVLRVGQVVD